MNRVEAPHGAIKRRRRWPRFSIRTLLLAVLVFCVLLAWLGRDVARSRFQRSIVTSIEAAGGSVYYDYQLEPGRIDLSKSPRGSAFVRSLLGDDIYATVNVVYFIERTTTDDDIANSRGLSDVFDITVSGPGVTDRFVDDLLSFERLSSLKLIETSITAKGLAKLAKSKTLQHLTLYGADVSDAHLEQVPRIPNLEYLQIFRAPVTDVGIESLGSMTRLRQLDLFEVRAVTDCGVQQLGDLVNLEQLQMVQTGATDASMPTISKMVALKLLRLDGHPITDDGIRHLTTLNRLEVLQLAHTKTGDSGLEIVGKLTRLKHLDLSGTAISNAGLRYLKPLSNLLVLNISDTSVTDAGLDDLRLLSSLTHLDLEIGNRITSTGIDRLRPMLPDCRIRCWERLPNGDLIADETWDITP